MHLPEGKRWFSVSLLAVVLPMSLLAALRLTGVLPEPPPPETITIDAVSWEIERPDTDWGPMRETVENSYRDDGCSALFGIFISKYDNNAMEYLGSDYVFVGAEVKANVSNGFVEGLRISFNENYNWSQVNILEKQDFKYASSKSENLQTRNIVDYADGKGGTGGLGESLKGYVEAVGVNRPNRIHYSISVAWILQSPQDQGHQMEVALQLTYNNGTALKEAVLPVVLKLASDAGNTFETAKEIGFGSYTGWYHIIADPEDFYKVWIDEGKTVKIQLSPKESIGYLFELYLYNILGELVGSSGSKIRDNIEQITFTINQSGWWYIRVVNADAGYGLYVLLLEEAEPQ